eukprot:TRINITY_DN3422_c0_g1_i1.p1 TRINITY_DN3422_c0_g1~~TRINITY_DN3422_c0_g1_i1.p1  ORF type:complete len:262 (-),score=20.74 TRINITY_DN3422_c0_g1_i1:10-795(-)
MLIPLFADTCVTTFKDKTYRYCFTISRSHNSGGISPRPTTSGIVKSPTSLSGGVVKSPTSLSGGMVKSPTSLSGGMVKSPTSLAAPRHTRTASTATRDSAASRHSRTVSTATKDLAPTRESRALSTSPRNTTHLTPDGKLVETMVTYSHTLRAGSRDDFEEWTALLQRQIDVIADPSKISDEFTTLTLPSGGHRIISDLEKLGLTRHQGEQSILGIYREQSRTTSVSLKKDDSRSLSAPSSEIGRAVQQECRDRSRMPSSA